MTQFMLKTCVPAAAAALDRSDTEPVSTLMHREGVNVRHLDKLLATMKKTGPLLKTPAARMRVARDMLERTIKNILRRAMRDVITKSGSISELLELATVTFNCVTGAEVDTEKYWNELLGGARERFGGANLKKFLSKEAQESMDGKVEFGDALRAIERNDFDLKNASDQMKSNKVVVLAAVMKRGKALEFASDDMKNTEDVVVAAVTQDGKALKWASKEMKSKEAIVVAAVKQDVASHVQVLQFACCEVKYKVQQALDTAAGGKVKAALSADSLTDGVRIFESTHPYEKDMEEQTLVEFEGADAIAVIFDGKSDDDQISEKEIEAKWKPFSRTNMDVCRASPGTMVLRVAEDVGIELTATCSADLRKVSGKHFAFNSADIARLVPRIKYLDILNKAEGMALADRLGDGNDDCGGQDAATNITTRLRLLCQAASKLRIAVCGVFPDREVATKLAEVRLEQLKLIPDDKVLRETARMAFDELRAFPHDDGGVANRDASEGGEGKVTEGEMGPAQHAVDLAGALMNNPNLKAEDGVVVLLDGLVKTRVGSSVKPPAQLMTPDVRAALGDRIVRWGIEHGDWGTCDEEKVAMVAKFDVFVNGSLKTLVGSSMKGEGGGVEAGGEEEKEAKEEKGKTDSSIQNVTCGDTGGKHLENTREWIKGVMVVETLKDFAKIVGLSVDAEAMEGVTREFGEKGQITKIRWKGKNLNGNLDKLTDFLAKRMPRLQVLDLGENDALKGDLTQWHLPVGMKDLDLSETKVTGAVDKLALPEGMQTVNFNSCYSLTGAVDKLALPEGMQTVNFNSCNRLTGAVYKLVLPEGMQNVNFNRCTGLTGAVDKLLLPEGMQSVDFECCTGLTGAVDKLLLPDGMQSVNFQYCRGLTTAPPGCPRGSSYDFNYNEDDLNRLRSWISLTATQGGAAGEDGNEGKAGGDGEGATEMEALRAFAESVGYKGNIMDGVVTECARGAIEEIHWRETDLAGALPVGDLNMPKLRVLDLCYNDSSLKGDLAQLQLPVSLQDLHLKGCIALTGNIGQLNLPVGLQTMNFVGCTGLTGAVDKLVLPEGMQSVDFNFCKGLTGAVDKLVLPEGMQNLNFRFCTGITGDIGQLSLPVGMQTVNFCYCEGITGCLSWHCRMEPKVGEAAGDRIPGMKYDTLMPEYIEPYLNGRSWEDLKVGDEIAFPEKDDTITPESLVNRRITINEEYEGTIESFDPSTGKHEVAFDDGDKESFDFKGEKDAEGVVIEGAEGYIGGQGVCIIHAVDKLVLPDGMQSVNFQMCGGLTGDIAQMNLPVGMQSVNFMKCNGLTGAVDKLVLPEGMQTLDFRFCEGLTGELPASEKAKVVTYTAPNPNPNSPSESRPLLSLT
jgi:hypothetical protein